MDPLYHPETDISEFISTNDIAKYRMMIGCGLWAITLGRFDIHYGISTLSQYSMAPHQGHFSALLRIFGYLRAYVKGKIIINTNQPDYSHLSIEKHDWKEFYPNVKE